MMKKCERCYYEWESLIATPKVCPRCKSYFWCKKKKNQKNGNHPKD